jgi:hypothetical protein
MRMRSLSSLPCPRPREVSHLAIQLMGAGRGPFAFGVAWLADVASLCRFIMAQAVTILAGVACMPVDVLRRRLMLQAGGALVYAGTWDCLVKIVRTEGVGVSISGSGYDVSPGTVIDAGLGSPP